MRSVRLTLGTRVTVLTLATAILLLVIAGAAAVEAARGRVLLDTALNHIGPVKTLAETLTTRMVEQEAAIRAYATAADPVDLLAYREAGEAQRSLSAEIDVAIADRPDLRDLLRLAHGRMEEWRSSVAEPVLTAVARKDLARAQALLTSGARARFASVRQAMIEFNDGLAGYRAELSHSAQAGSDRMIQLLIVAACVVLVSKAILLVGLRRLVTGPVTAFAAEVRRVADGDYHRPLRVTGATEVADLAHDVDAMRRRILTDLTQLHELNGELHSRAVELDRSNRDLEQFAYVASHDLQEPLRKVASFCQLLQRRYSGRLDEKADQYIAFAVDGAQRMQQLINDLLAFSRIGRSTSGFTDVDLGALAAEAVAQLEYPISRTKAKVTWDALPVVRGEAALLAALLANLIGNAVKFHREGVAPRVRLSARMVADEWHITCADNGIGIDPAYADKVFIIFQRLHPRDTYAGTGIGLAIAKKIVEHHAGRIWLDPPAGTGTSITFSLPAYPGFGVAPQAGAPTIEEAADDAAV